MAVSSDTLRIAETYYSGRLVEAKADRWLFDIDCNGNPNEVKLSAEVQVDVNGECTDFYPPGIGGDFPGLCEITTASKLGQIKRPRFVFLGYFLDIDGTDIESAGFLDYFVFSDSTPVVGFLGDIGSVPNSSFGIRVYDFIDVEDWCD